MPTTTTDHTSTPTESDPTDDRPYRTPDRFTRSVLNPLVAWCTRWGISVWGSRVLEVRGRRSGEWRATPVNLHHHAGQTFLVSPRGQTQWVRNLRAAGEGRLRLGRRRWAFTATEVDPADAADVLRAYLQRWRWEVGQFFDGVGPDASSDELAAIAHRHPVFVIDLESASWKGSGR